MVGNVRSGNIIVDRVYLGIGGAEAMGFRLGRRCLSPYPSHYGTGDW